MRGGISSIASVSSENTGEGRRLEDAGEERRGKESPFRKGSHWELPSIQQVGFLSSSV